MKKFLSAFLAVLMILTAVFVMVSCNDPVDPDPGKDPGTGSTPNTPNTPNTPGDDDDNKTDSNERIPLDYLPTDGYNNAKFHILEWSCNGVDEVGVSWIPWEEGDVEADDGDRLGQAVYDRNAWVEETFGVEITKEYVSIDGAPSYQTRIRNDATTSGNEFQLFTMRTVEILWMIEEDLFADMNNYMEYIHFDEPWWVEDSVDSFKLGSHQYVASSEMLLRDKGATAALFFNQDLHGDFVDDLPNFFDLASDGVWTIEEMIAACEIVAHSDDDNDLMDSTSDVWGCFGQDDPLYFLFNGFGYKFAHVDKYGYIDYDFADEETAEGQGSVKVMQEIFEDVMYAPWYMNSYLNKGDILADNQDLFVDGQSLFKSGMVKDATNSLKYMTQKYGILPHPKYTVDQEEYSSLVWVHHDSIVGIPSHAANKSMCAVILEALSWESYYSVYPVFYDTILLSRAAKDTESKEMLEIIFDTRSYDPGQYWDSNSGFHGEKGLLRLSASGSSDIAHVWGELKESVDKNITQVNNWISGMED